jgi:hypothetical protein
MPLEVITRIYTHAEIIADDDDPGGPLSLLTWISKTMAQMNSKVRDLHTTAVQCNDESNREWCRAPGGAARICRKLTAAAYLIHKGLVHVVRSSNTQIDDMHFQGQCIVERIQEPTREWHLIAQDEQQHHIFHHMWASKFNIKLPLQLWWNKLNHHDSIQKHPHREKCWTSEWF